MATRYLNRSIPYVTDTYSPADKSISTSTYTDLGSLSYSVGTWLTLVYVQFANNATGTRAARTSGTSGASTRIGIITSTRCSAVEGRSTNLNYAYMERFTTTTTRYFIAWQNSGSSVSTALRVVRIKLG